ncbi:MAG: hypothetical protein DCF31_08315 [Alphaproteobacteria bacterium]|nr:MAG: hypothetical protein DCF31_08315 [Alphaproteobacteria bacterium]
MSAGWTPAEKAAFDARRKSRNTALGLLLGALVLLFFGITVVRMAPGLQNGKPQPGFSQAQPSSPAQPRQAAP